MPRYDYRCGDCGEQFEAVQSFDESTLDTCPHCSGSHVRKLFGNVGVVFKGSGFYRNDSREAGKSGSEKSPESSTESSVNSSGEDKKSSETKSKDAKSKSDGPGKKDSAPKAKSSAANDK